MEKEKEREKIKSEDFIFFLPQGQEKNKASRCCLPSSTFFSFPLNSKGEKKIKHFLKKKKNRGWGGNQKEKEHKKKPKIEWMFEF